MHEARDGAWLVGGLCGMIQVKEGFQGVTNVYKKKN